MKGPRAYHPGMSAKRLIIAGGSGFLGRSVARHFTRQGWDVVTLSRTPPGLL